MEKKQVKYKHGEKELYKYTRQTTYTYLSDFKFKDGFMPTQVNTSTTVKKENLDKVINPAKIIGK